MPATFRIAEWNLQQQSLVLTTPPPPPTWALLCLLLRCSEQFFNGFYFPATMAAHNGIGRGLWPTWPGTWCRSYTLNLSSRRSEQWWPWASLYFWGHPGARFDINILFTLLRQENARDIWVIKIPTKWDAHTGSGALPNTKAPCTTTSWQGIFVWNIENICMPDWRI